MTGLLNLIVQQIPTIDLSNPISILDILLAVGLIIGFFIYIYRFPVFRVVLGGAILFLFSALFLSLKFYFTAWLFGLAANLVVISMPLVFAPEIRHYLEKLGRLPFAKLPPLTSSQKARLSVRSLLDGIYEMADKKIGASVVLARRTGLANTIETGVLMIAKFSSKLLESIFFPKSPLHDGAVIIKGNQILAAKCLLPISSAVKLDPPFGTRHSSALGITKDTDALVIVVSEQRGEVSLTENGRLHSNLKKQELSEMLYKMWATKNPDDLGA